MLIERKLKTPGGTPVEIGNKSYLFVGEGDEPHVCEVKDTEHAELLLGLDGGKAYVKAKVAAPEKPELDIDEDLVGLSRAKLVELAKAELGAVIDRNFKVAEVAAEITRLRAEAASADDAEELNDGTDDTGETGADDLVE